MGCLFISSPSFPVQEMINVPPFLVMASVDKVWPWRTFLVLKCWPISLRPSKGSGRGCQQEPRGKPSSWTGGKLSNWEPWEDHCLNLRWGISESVYEACTLMNNTCSPAQVLRCCIKKSNCLTCGDLSQRQQNKPNSTWIVYCYFSSKNTPNIKFSVLTISKCIVQ